MEIGFDSKRLFCNYTGLGNYSRTLLRNLGRFYPEHTYHLYTPEIRENKSTEIFLTDPLYLPHTPRGAARAIWRSFTINKQLIKDNILLYHGLSHEIPFRIDKTPLKSVVTIHDLIFRIHPETYSPIDCKIYDYKFRYACEHADRIIAISENTKKDIIRFYHIEPEKINVIYQACHPDYYDRPVQEKTDALLKPFRLPAEYMLSVGSVEPRKNIIRVLESYRHLKPDIRIPLVIVGKGGKYKQQAERLVLETGLEKLVIWINGLDNTSQIQALYQNSSLLIYPSLYEGFGLPVAEALLCRTPVITSRRSSLPEAGGPGSLYIDPESPEEIALAIEKVLTGTSFREQMVETGWQYAHRTFAPGKVTRQVMECYQGVLQV